MAGAATPDARWREGSCHCGAIRFRVRVGDAPVWSCDCSMCRRRADLQWIVPLADFELVSGEDALVEYQFNTRVAVHRFCGTCGIHPFNTPRSNPDQVAVNARCVDGVDVSRLEVVGFDGVHWERTMGLEE